MADVGIVGAGAMGLAAAYHALKAGHSVTVYEGDSVPGGMAAHFDFGGVSIQPQFGSGRSASLDPLDRLTHTGVLARLEEQTHGRVTWRDLTALPCSHPHCCSVGYLLRDDSGSWRSLVALIGPERLKQWLDLEPELPG